MPSGAKKRKAAKKKKELQHNTNPSNNPPHHGENELKSIDEKGSDGGEGNSPVYGNDNDRDNRFNEGSEEAEEGEQSAAAGKSSEEVRNDSKVDETEGGKEGVVVIEWDMKSDESCENKDVSVVQVESAKESNHENGNSGDSNDVSEVGIVENSKVELYDSSVKEVAAFDEVVDSVKESVNLVAESSADSVNGVTSVSKMQSGDSGNVLSEKLLSSKVTETDTSRKKDEDKVTVLPDEDVRTSSLEEPETREFDIKVSSLVSQSPIPESTNGVEYAKDSNDAERSENQPPLVSAPLLVRKTSWLSCCGLFEVFSGSNR